MKIIDSNIHLPLSPNLEHELNLTLFNPKNSLNIIQQKLSTQEYIGGNIMILDPNFIKRKDFQLLRDIKKQGFKTTIMINPNDANAYELVEIAAQQGIGGIKFHPYLQSLKDKQFKHITQLARHISQLGMWIAVDCSYGTHNLYNISGVRLVNALSQFIDTPIIALHGGGKLILDIMSIALASPQVIIDLSFSVPYWCGSSIEKDFIFAIQKVGSERFIFGSDYPYVNFNDATDSMLKLLNESQCQQPVIDNIMYKTAARVFGYELHSK